MTDGLTPEEEERYINDIAKSIVNVGLETPASVILEILRPLGYMFSSTILLANAPILEFFQLPGFDYVHLFRKRANIEKLLERIDELAKEKK